MIAAGVTPRRTEALDGLMAITLAVIVIGLMAALGPALRADPILVLKWLTAAMIANLGLQVGAYRLLKHFGHKSSAAPLAVVAGNRNFALFLIALPAATTEPLLVFLGCYQVPMYLTATLMRRFYRDQPVPGN